MKGDFGGGGDGMPMSNYDISRRGGDMTSPPRYMGGGGFGQRSGGMMGFQRNFSNRQQIPVYNPNAPATPTHQRSQNRGQQPGTPGSEQGMPGFPLAFQRSSSSWSQFSGSSVQNAFAMAGTPGTPMSGTPMAGTPRAGTPVPFTPIIPGAQVSGTPMAGTPRGGTPVPFTPIIPGAQVSGTPVGQFVPLCPLMYIPGIAGTPGIGTPVAPGTPVASETRLPEGIKIVSFKNLAKAIGDQTPSTDSSVPNTTPPRPFKGLGPPALSPCLPNPILNMSHNTSKMNPEAQAWLGVNRHPNHMNQSQYSVTWSNGEPRQMGFDRSAKPFTPMRGGGRGPSYPSYKPSYKPRGGYNSYNSYNKTNRQQFSEQQLKDRSNISDADWNVCWEFNSKRGCRRGSACKWKHMSFATTDNVCHPVTKEPLNIGGIAGGPAPSTGDAEKTASPEQQQTQEQATTTQEPPKEEASEPSVAAAFAAAVAGRIAAADKAEKACAADKAGKPAPLPKADEPSASVDNKSAPKAEETEEAKNEKAGSGGDAKPDKAGTDGQKVQPIAVE